MNRHQRRAKKKEKSSYFPPGVVLERADTGEAMDHNQLIDLEDMGKEMGGTAKFNTRPADPMRPFNKHKIAEIRGEQAAELRNLKYVPPDTKIGDIPPGKDGKLHLRVEKKGSLAGQKALADYLLTKDLPERIATLTTELEHLYNSRDASDDWASRLGGLTAIIDKLLPANMARAMMHDVRERLGAPKFANALMSNASIDRAGDVFEGMGGFDPRTDLNFARVAQAGAEIAIMAKDPKLQKLGESRYHSVMETYQAGEMILPEDYTSDAGKRLAEVWGDVNDYPKIFVVQHDWAGAFEKATDFHEGEVRLPYHTCAFEFRVSGRRVVMALVSNSDQGVIDGALLNIETSVGWALGASYEIRGGNWTPIQDKSDLCGPITNLCRLQVRAILIALEAEVAVVEIVRAPHRLNRKRERAGKLPIFDHHIVNLVARKRYLPRVPEPADIEDEIHHRRLHFVRGHWRHFTNSKSWIKWHLRGDPDLGFVDKEYRL